MRSIYLVIAVIAIVIVSTLCGSTAFAENGENTAAVTEAVKNGVSQAAPAAFSGNWLGAAFGFLAGSIPGLLAVLQHQASTRWNIFHAQNAISAAKAQVSTDPAKA